MINEHSAPIYKEPMMIAIPAEIYNDKNLAWIEKITYALMAKQRGRQEIKNNAELADELGIKYARLKQIKAKLHAAGYLARVKDLGQIRYMPIDSAAAAWEKLVNFRRVSTQGFKQISDDQIRLLQGKHDLDKILYCMEVLEHTYRKSPNKSIGKPIHLLRSAVIRPLTPDPDFKRGFWIHDQKKVERIQHDAERRAAIEKLDDQNADQREREFKIYLGGIQGTDELTKLNNEARERIKIKGIPRAFVSSPLIRAEMKTIFFERRCGL